LGKCVRRERLDLRFLAFESANLQARVLRTVKHFLPMQTKERFGGIFPRCFSVMLSVRTFAFMQ
jgi:hypothetical protein